MSVNLRYRPLDNIGLNGLNLQANPSALDPSWLTKADNIILRESGRVSFRKGLKQSVLKTTDKIGAIGENGAGVVVAAVGTNMYTVDFTTPDIPWTSAFATGGTASDWQMIPFNREIYCVQAAHTPVELDSGTWTALPSTTGYSAPTGISSFNPSCGMGFYGRLWVGGVNEAKDVVYYSDTLNAHIWHNTTALTTIQPSTSYKISSVIEDTANTITTGLSYKINSFKELTSVTAGQTYKILSDIREAEDTTIVVGQYYEIISLKGSVIDWSSVGGAAASVVGATFKATNTNISTLGVVRLSWLNLGGTGEAIIGDTFTATASDIDISDTYGSVRKSDWSTLGGQINAKVDDLFVATATTSIADYGDVVLDWRELGGPAIANVNDTFTTKATVTADFDITAYGEVTINPGLSGYIDLKTVWGTDEIISIAAFYGKLVIFGKNNIAIYDNPTDPNNMALDEVIRGIGCVARDSVQAVGDDLYFLSSTGVRSLNRTTEKDKIPLQDLSLTIKDTIIRNISQSTEVKAVYVENDGTYILSFTALNITYVFDIKHNTPSGTPRITTWSFNGDIGPSSFAYTNSKGFLIGQLAGSIATYEGYYDKEYVSGGTYTSTSYTGVFKTTWIDLGQGSIASLLKKLKTVIAGGSGTTIGVKWYKDFSNAPSKATNFLLNPTSSGTAALFGASTSLYGDSKYAPIYSMKEYDLHLAGSAKYLQLEVSGETSGYTFSLQDMTLLYKEGKIR